MPQLFQPFGPVTDFTLTRVTAVTRSAKTVHGAPVPTLHHPEVTFGTSVVLLLALQPHPSLCHSSTRVFALSLSFVSSARSFEGRLSSKRTT